MLNRVATLNPAGTNSWGNQFQARSGLSAPNYSVAQTQATQFQGAMAASIRPAATFQAYARQAYTSTGIAATYAAQMQHTAFPVAQAEVIYDGDIWDDWGPTLGFGWIPELSIPILVDSDIWQPNLPSSIPVPVGAVDWGWNGAAALGDDGWALIKGASAISPGVRYPNSSLLAWGPPQTHVCQQPH